MRKFIVLIILLFMLFQIGLKAQNIYTVAGDSVQGYNGDSIQATAAELYDPGGIALDGRGNIYIADYNNGRVRKVNLSNGIITTVAGSGLFCHAGNRFSGPSDAICDTSGNIFVSDVCIYEVLKVNAITGAVSVVAGNDLSGSSGDGGPATNAKLANPTGITLDANGNLYIADVTNNTIRKVDATTGIITTIAGTGTAGYNGDGIPATSAELNGPAGVGVDVNGNIYISEDARIREISSSTGLISTIAGTGTLGYNGDGIPATSAQIYYPGDVAIDAANNIFIPDVSNNRVRKVTIATGLISTVAGDSVHGYNGDGIPATSAELYSPTKVAIDNVGRIYIADTWNNRIRRVDLFTGIKENTSSNVFKVYPNPSNGVFFIGQQGMGNKEQVEVYNVLGEKIYQHSFSASPFTLHLTGQPAGIYSYRITSEKGELLNTGKLVIY